MRSLVRARCRLLACGIAGVALCMPASANAAGLINIGGTDSGGIAVSTDAADIQLGGDQVADATVTVAPAPAPVANGSGSGGTVTASIAAATGGTGTTTGTSASPSASSQPTATVRVGAAVGSGATGSPTTAAANVGAGAHVDLGNAPSAAGTGANATAGLGSVVDLRSLTGGDLSAVTDLASGVDLGTAGASLGLGLLIGLGLDLSGVLPHGGPTPIPSSNGSHATNVAGAAGTPTTAGLVNPEAAPSSSTATLGVDSSPSVGLGDLPFTGLAVAALLLVGLMALTLGSGAFAVSRS